MEGFRAARAFVEVSAKINDAEVLDAARRAAEALDRRMRSGAQDTGDEVTRVLSNSGDRGGRELANRAEGRLRDARGRFTTSGTEIGDNLGRATASTFGASLTKNMPDALVSGKAVLLALLAPTIGATISAAVIGGAAGLGIVGGVILAARDERVKAAGKDLGAFVLADLEARSTAFVPEVLDGIGEIRHAWIDMGPDLDRIFKSSRLMDPLVAGMTSGARKLVHGVADAVDKADPVVDAFGRLLDGVGDAAGQAFTTLSEDADEGASAIDDLTLAMSSLIETAAGIAHVAATIKGYTDQVDVAIDKGRYWLEDWVSSGGAMEHFGWQLDLTADGFKAGTREAEAWRAVTTGAGTVADFATLKTAGLKDAQIAAADSSGTYRQKIGEVNDALGITPAKATEVSAATRIMNQSMADAVTAAGSLSDAFKILNGGALTAREAESNYQAAIDGVTESVKKNGKGLDLHTEKGRANDKQLRSLIGSIDAKAQAAYADAAATGDVVGAERDAKAAYAAGREQLIKSAMQMGLSKKEAIAYADRLMKIPKSWETKVDIKDMATAKAKAIKHEISTINGKTVVIAVKYETHGSVPGEHIIGQGTQTKATGGWITGGSGYKDDVPLLAMGDEFMIQKPAALALARTFGRGFLDRLNNWHTGRTPNRPDRINAVDPAVSAIGGVQRAPDMSAVVQNGTPGDRQHTGTVFGPGAVTINLDVSRLRTVDDLIRTLDTLRQTARSAYGAGVTG